MNQRRLFPQTRQGLCSGNHFVIKGERNAQDGAPGYAVLPNPSNEEGLGEGSKYNIQAEPQSLPTIFADRDIKARLQLVGALPATSLVEASGKT